MNIDIFNGSFKRKRVLVTGHTGFKGSWLSIWLHELGAEVVGVGLEPFSEKDNYVLSGIGKRIILLSHCIPSFIHQYLRLVVECVKMRHRLKLSEKRVNSSVSSQYFKASIASK